MNPENLPGTSSRRQFLKISTGALVLPAAVPIADAAPVNQPGLPVPEEVGPVLGHVDPERIFCFVRSKAAAKVTLTLRDEAGKTVATREAMAEEQNDLTVRFAIEGLEAGTKYRGEVQGDDGKYLFPGSSFEVQTAPNQEAAERVVLGMGSCASSTSYDELWQQVERQGVEGFCLLGDTPYIDSNDLTANRAARRLFWGHLPTLGKLAKRIPFWNTWDDHDFGKNDSDGLMPKKEDIRKAFLEYNALASYGEEGAGIYTHFRRGPVEVWLLDDRWFSQTEDSWTDAGQKTCLGEKQWEWLKRTLKASTAPFKLLCGGMVWYPKGNKEKDHWETYSAEREAIFAFVKEEKIPGVVLVSGDIHVSRHHRYEADRVGYPLHECVVSPMHASVIPALDVAHAARIWSKPEPNVFLTVDADPKVMRLKWINMMGIVVYETTMKAAELKS